MRTRRLIDLLVVMCVTLLWAAPSLSQVSPEGTVDIVIGNADNVRKDSVVPSAALNELIATVKERLTVQFSNAIRHLDLIAQPPALQILLANTKDRTVVQYANTIRHENLALPPTTMESRLAVVANRIVFQFANTNRLLGLAYPRELLNDTTVPTIQSFQNEGGVPNGKISWSTSEFAKCKVLLGTQPDNLVEIFAEQQYAKAHAVPTTNLVAGTTYYVQIICTDQSENTSSTNSQFTAVSVSTPTPTLMPIPSPTNTSSSPTATSTGSQSTPTATVTPAEKVYLPVVTR